MTACDRNSQTANPTANTEDDVQFTNTAIPDGAEDVEAAEVREAKDELTEFEGMPLYPADEDGATAAGLSLDDPLPRPPAGHSLSWTDPRPDPASRGEAIAAVRVALLELAAQPGLADPDNRDAVLFQVGHLSDRYRYKSRPWFSGTLSDMADGKIDPPPGWSLSIAAEFPVHKRHYRLQRVTGHPEAVAP